LEVVVTEPGNEGTEAFKIPLLDLGNVGNGYHDVPMYLVINLSHLVGVSEEQYVNQPWVMGENWGNCEDWRAKAEASNNFADRFEWVCKPYSSSGQLLDDDQQVGLYVNPKLYQVPPGQVPGPVPVQPSTPTKGRGGGFGGVDDDGIDDDSNVGAIVGGVIGICVVGGIIAGVTIYWRMKKQQEGSKKPLNEVENHE
jgi:hypothetical protein